MIDDHSMDAKFHDLAERDRQMERRTDGAMGGWSNGWTETLAYWDAMDASKKLYKTVIRVTVTFHFIFLIQEKVVFRPLCK